MFKPGQSGNPAGRPPGSISLVSALKKHLKENPDEVKQIVLATIRDAKEGDAQARKLVWDRIDGPVAQQINVSQLTDDQLLAVLAAAGTGESEEGSTEEGA